MPDGAAGETMRVHALVVGPVATNAYVVDDPASREALAVDPGGSVGEILSLLARRGLRLAAIVNTHGHFDHVSGNRALREATGARLLLHRADAAIAARARDLAAFVRHVGVDSPPPDAFLEEGDEVCAGEVRLRVLHTPGHTPGGVTLVGGGAAFCGDLLFAGGPGLTGLPGCEPQLLLETIRSRILTLPAETRLHPGHGPATTVGAERDDPRYRERA